MIKNQFSPGRANWSMSKLGNFLFSLPPLEIQERIVKKLDDLMAVCDQLENTAHTSQQKNGLLLQQVLREALEPEGKVNNKN